MKKISSFVLMAVMLLMSANTWAANVTVASTIGTRAELQAAIDGVTAGSTVTLTLQNDFTLDGPVWLGTENLDGARKSIILDLNGHDVNMTAAGAACYMFVLSHGELLVRNSSDTESQIKLTGTTGTNASSQIFSVYGSYRSSRWNADGNSTVSGTSTCAEGYFSHLEIGERVHIIGGPDVLATAISVDQLNHASSSPARTAATKAGSKTINYWTDLHASSYGYAYGVRVDVKGDIDMSGRAGSDSKGQGWKCYGIKTNGNLESPKSGKTIRVDSKNVPVTKMNGVEIAYLSNYDANVEAHKLDTLDVPFVHVHSTSNITTTDASTRSAAVYASGYAKWLIEGNCEGNVGAFVSSGTVDINDATITSTATTYTETTGKGGVSGSGSAIVISSRDGYAGGTDVTISGDTKVTADAGYAIEETVKTSEGETKVETVTIEGGTIEGGDKGAIVVTEATITNPETDVVVYGGNIQGDVEVENPTGTGDLNDLLPKDNDDNATAHITVITGSDGKTTLVVSDGANAPAGDSYVAAGHNKDSRVRWTGSYEEISADLELKELVMNEMDGVDPMEQTLVIKAGKKLIVGHVIMSEGAQIYVEAGAQFFVTGNQGITSSSYDNIILETSATAQALFLVNPSVNSNKHPMAKVQMTSKGYYDSDEDKYYYQRFGVPSYEASVSFTDIDKSEPSAFMKLVSDAWVEVDYANWSTEKLEPFTTYAVTAANADAVYTFSCNLVGNSNATLPLTGKWNYYANSYTAPISIDEIIDDYMTKYTNVSATIYLHDLETNLWHPVNKSTVHSHPEYASVIKPMHAFIIQRRAAGSNPVINYKDEVYTPTLASLSAAPARTRAMAPSFATAVIEIAAADGTKDEVSLLEGEQFSADFDNAYDATKLMNGERTYIYADGVDEKFGIIATDNLEGTTLSLDAKEQTSFIMTVRNADGMNYAIRDMLTGTEVELTEGATYMFSVPANTTVNGRFKVVGLHKVPTAIESIEEVAATKGIYNMAGQYMGNDFYSLSAGVYVVDGKKIVK